MRRYHSNAIDIYTCWSQAMNDKILLIEINQIDSPNARHRLEQFQKLYFTAFPDPNEREEIHQWCERISRIQDNRYLPVFHILLAVKEMSKSSVVVGGIVFEYYRKSSCGLLTYLAVDAGSRRGGIARMLLDQATKILHNDAQNAKRSLNIILAESNDPRKVSKQMDSIEPNLRLKILSRLGGKWIDIDYVQPSLSPGKQRVRNLLLIIFPEQTSGSSAFNTIILSDFLVEFYSVLGVPHPHRDPDLQRMKKGLEEHPVLLKELPVTENSIS